MPKYNYCRYKIRIASDSEKKQGLAQGDIVRRQYADKSRTVYSLMVVLETGEERIETPGGISLSPYFIGALLDGDEPRDGELLDFVRVSNFFDENRSGALYLTSSDSEAPYMDAIDGVGTASSLCRPTAGGGSEEVKDPDRYCCTAAYFTSEYKSEEDGIRRIFRMCRNDVAEENGQKAGLIQNLNTKIGHPQRAVISFRIRASKSLTGVPLVMGYTGDNKVDGQDEIEVSTQWQYKLSVITTDYPEDYRTIRLDLTGLLDAGDWLEVAELNICLLSDIASFSKATRVRVGKISGVADPLFGVLDGYGAYFQNLYATKNVSVAGTLTAGDQDGFASTFYVGRIHRNCFLNSLHPKFTTIVIPGSIKPPTGIGSTYLLPIGTTTLECQSEDWALAHKGEPYCFSFWGYATGSHTITVEHGGEAVGTLDIGTQWERHHLNLRITHVAGEPLRIHLSGSATFFFASPQLEAGTKPTLYQPTDAVLNETDEYGAWLCRGGIGGTIQNPLLRLEADGTIRSAGGSFVINADGTGHFSGGRFRWTQDSIELRGVTIRWEDFDEEAQKALLPLSVSISGTDTFHYSDALASVIQPASITLVATEQNFMAETRRWEYLSSDGVWKDAGSHAATLMLTPDFHAWEERDVLTLRYTAAFQQKEYSGTFTVTKQYDGESAYSICIQTDKGTVIQNGIGETTLSARVMRGAEEVTELIPDEKFLWTRQSDDPDSDMLWNASEYRGRKMTINGNDVSRKAVFTCEVKL